jgi:hypothetical protein
MKTGLIEVGGKSYFLTSSGAMAANRFVKLPDGTERFANADGVLDGTYRKDGVYYNPDGSKVTGWLKDGGKWYYIDDSGNAATGWQKNQGRLVWFDKNGVMVTGERTIDGKKQYFKDDGAWIDADAVRKAIVNAAYSQIGAAYTEANDILREGCRLQLLGLLVLVLQGGRLHRAPQAGLLLLLLERGEQGVQQMWWVEKRATGRRTSPTSMPVTWCSSRPSMTSGIPVTWACTWETRR